MNKSIPILMLLTALACNQPAEQPTSPGTNNGQPSCCNNSEFLAQATLWFQQSPEMRASYIQSYNLARLALDENLKHKTDKKKKNAVVVDIDETVLNNGPYEGWLYLHNTTYTDSSWNAWVFSAKAEPLPGALEFLQYAASKGCDVFYISNRKKDSQAEPTLKNLQLHNFPNADAAHLLLKGKDDTTALGKTTKEKRRHWIEQELGFEILLLCGDQLADFTQAFDVQPQGTEKQIKDSVDAYAKNFGSRYFIIPNPMYSDWLSQDLYGSDKNKTCTHVDSIRRSKVGRWE